MSEESHSLNRLLDLIADGLAAIDLSGVPYRSTRPPYREYGVGVGPYSETVLCKKLTAHFVAAHSVECTGACTRRFPDILVPGRWAVELKLARPFGDNGEEAEHWSQNLLHPYPGNTSSLSDAMKLLQYDGPERTAIVVVGYEHSPAKISLDPLIAAFEAIALHTLRLPLGPRHTRELAGLVHPHLQLARLWAWEVIRPGARRS